MYLLSFRDRLYWTLFLWLCFCETVLEMDGGENSAIKLCPSETICYRHPVWNATVWKFWYQNSETCGFHDTSRKNVYKHKEKDRFPNATAYYLWTAATVQKIKWLDILKSLLSPFSPDDYVIQVTMLYIHKALNILAVK